MIDISNAIQAERELQNAVGQQTADHLERVSQALVNGANPDCNASPGASKSLLIAMMDRGDVEVVAMLLAAGANLDRPTTPGSGYRMSPRQVMAGNLGDLSRAETDLERSNTLAFPRVANARRIAFLVAPQELADYAYTSPLVMSVLMAANAAPRLTRLAAGWTS